MKEAAGVKENRKTEPEGAEAAGSGARRLGGTAADIKLGWLLNAVWS